eukprot:333326-Chlamydomonas_euryale.AAC.2
MVEGRALEVTMLEMNDEGGWMINGVCAGEGYEAYEGYEGRVPQRTPGHPGCFTYKSPKT